MKKNLSLLFLYYLRFFARLQIKKLKLLNPKLKIVGITGSAGKTSCLLACQAALTSQFSTQINYAGNSETGLPLSILDLKMANFSLVGWLQIALLCPYKLLTLWPQLDVLLLEMGIDSPRFPKNMDFLLSVVHPNISIFLNVSTVHLENFQNIEQIAQEKAKLANTTPVSIVNNSDPLVKKYTTTKNIIPIQPVSIELPHSLLPPIFDITFGAAVALADLLQASTPIINLQNHFLLPPGRSSLFPGINNSSIIDSSYNSSPLATTEMLKLLSTQPQPRIAVLGDMRELGSASPTEHHRLYQLANKSADIIISVGPETHQYFGSKALKFSYWWQAADYLKSHPELVKSATILVKGSQNTIYLEELVKELIPANKLKDYLTNQLICRQSPYWLKLKAQFKSLAQTG